MLSLCEFKRDWNRDKFTPDIGDLGSLLDSDISSSAPHKLLRDNLPVGT